MDHEPAGDDAHARFVVDVFDRGCPSRGVLDHVTSRWGVLALVALQERPFRFNELRRRVDGVSEKMLAQTLQTLERDGFVHREAEASIPPRVEYSLTALGSEVAAQLRVLIGLVEERAEDVMDARDVYDTSPRPDVRSPAPSSGPDRRADRSR